MVQDRKEPTFSSIKPERDEIATHQHSGQKRPANGGGARPANRPAASRPEPSSGSPLTAIALVVAIVAVGVAGYAVWQLQSAQDYMAKAEDRIVELVGRLNLTNDESDQSVSAIHEKLEWADSELRKLWGVSNDTNHKAIAANKDMAAQAASNAKAAKDTSDGLKTAVSSASAKVNEQQLIISQLSEDLAQAQRQLKQVGETATNLESQVGKLGDLQSRVKTNEEAIQAIDAFRRSANADIQALKQRALTP